METLTEIKVRGIVFKDIPVIYGLAIIRGLPEVFCKKDVLHNFAKFTGKDLCQCLFFNKVVRLRPELC